MVHVKLLEPGRRLAAESAVPARMFLPGLVGSGALWLRGCQQVEEAYDAGEWLVIEGEPGVGKLALVRAVHQRRNPAGHFDVLDAADAQPPGWLVRAPPGPAGGRRRPGDPARRPARGPAGCTRWPARWPRPVRPTGPAACGWRSR